MAYKWTPLEALSLLGINVPNRTEVYITCPKCGGKRFSFNTAKGIGKCFQCDFGADSASYYAVSMNLSLKDARRDIERKLGLVPDAANNTGATVTPRPRVVYTPKIQEEEKAPAEVLDDTYRAFLAELTLSEKNRSMLKARGLSDSEIDDLGYKTLPRYEEIDFFALCRRLQRDGHILKGVPGFYKTKKGMGDYTFIQLTKGIIMPLVNINNQITGLQIRKDDDLRVYLEEIGDVEQKCGWFSSKNRDGGTAASADVHYACDFKFNRSKGIYEPIIPEKGVMLTEGIMKADITHFCQPNIPVIAVPGVNAINKLKEELLKLKELGLEVVLLAYDMDYATNKNVEKALAKTEEVIKECGLRLKKYDWPAKVNIEGKDINLNGIDDYLVFAKFGIFPLVKK